MPEVLMLSLPAEPVVVKESLKAVEPKVRHASLKQASDIVTPIYHRWKDQLHVGGLNWQAFQKAASSNASAWEAWLDGATPWPAAVDQLIGLINADRGGYQFQVDEAGL